MINPNKYKLQTLYKANLLTQNYILKCICVQV